MFRKILIANRGEIAIRIARTLREMGVATVAVYTDADQGSPHPSFADEARRLHGTTTKQTYLDIEQLVLCAVQAGADAIIPGYGFLSENPDFINACRAHGIAFIGPPESAVRMMGDKLAARETMHAAGVPIVPGGATHSVEEASELAQQVGFPLFVKAARGGGGKGMRRVALASELPAAWQRARSEALAAFGDGTVYLERALDGARHIEIQVLGDEHGNLVHLHERDCSVQRRHQKVVEETPAPHLPAALLEQMARAALQGARAVGYHSVGTFEFLVDANHEFYFRLLEFFEGEGAYSTVWDLVA